MADKDQYSRGEKLRQMRTNFGLTTQQLALLSKLPASMISHIENGYRNASKEALEKISQAFGMHAYNWYQDWLLEEAVCVPANTYQSILQQREDEKKRKRTERAELLRKAEEKPGEQTNEDDESLGTDMEIVQRTTLTWQPHHSNLEQIDIGEWIRYPAHKTMAERRLYDFMTEEDMLEAIPGKTEMLSLFNGGTNQIAMFTPSVNKLERLVIDAHSGEETYFITKGEMDYVVMARPLQLNDISVKRKFRSSRHDEHGQELRVLMEKDAAALVLYQYKMNHEENYEYFYEWFSKIIDNKKFDSRYKREYYEVPCEVFHLGPGDILRIDSKWPHGGMMKEGSDIESPPQAFFSAVGSFFTETTSSE